MTTKSYQHASYLLGLVTIIFFLPIQAIANRYNIPNADNAVVGELAYTTAYDGDSLLVIGERNNIGAGAMLNANPGLGGIYTSLLNLPVFLLGGLWGIHYLTQVHHLTPVQASYATSMLFVGVILGSPIFGWFSDHIGRRCLPMIIGAILSLVVILALMYTPNLSLTTLIILFFLIGFVTSSQVLSYPTIAELNPIALTGTAVSVASVTIMFSGVIFQPLFGWILELNWDHNVVNGVPIYSAEAFNYAMLIMPLAFVIGLGIAFMIRETYCESQV